MPIFYSWLPVFTLLLMAVLLAGAVENGPEPGLFADIHTGKGTMRARLFYRRAPLTVMNFVALAEGGTEWQHPVSGKKSTQPFYRNLSFHQIKEFMIQTGDPSGIGTGGPGYTFGDEFHPELRHEKAGILSMANLGPNTNGSQFFITRTEASWLDRHHSVFGEVITGLEIVDRIEVGGKLKSITIIRRGTKARNFDAKMAHSLAERQQRSHKKAAQKRLPDEFAPLDPDRLPQPDQPVVTPGAFEFIVIGHAGIRGAERIGKVFYYTHEEALEVAGKLVRLARSRGTDFHALAQRYSDMERDTRNRKVHDASTLSAAMKPIFRLSQGQVSDPIDLPSGIYIFYRFK
ncbi:MAG: peptidylprolyl isomerase [Gammaproteobacteria bacterium]|nr:peptidylprolyl isomerase [Gammaproteobacteria bacterium]